MTMLALALPWDLLLGLPGEVELALGGVGDEVQLGVILDDLGFHDRFEQVKVDDAVLGAHAPELPEQLLLVVVPGPDVDRPVRLRIRAANH
jgi:hypothetical protein